MILTNADPANCPPVLKAGRRPQNPHRETATDVGLHRHLAQWLDSTTTLADLIQGVAKLVSTHADCLGLWLVAPETPVTESATVPGRGFSIRPLIDSETSVENQQARQLIEQFSPALFEQDDALATPLPPTQNRVLAFCPVRSESKTILLLAGNFSVERQAETRHLWLLSLVAQAISNWNQKKAIEQFRQRVGLTGQLMELQRSMANARSLRQIGIGLANFLRVGLSARQVFVALANSSEPPQICAVSDVESFDQSAPSLRSAQVLTDRLQTEGPIEAIVWLNREPLDWPEVETFLDETQGQAGLAVRLQNGKREIGWALIALDHLETSQQDAWQQALPSQAANWGSLVDLTLRANESFGGRTWRQVKAFLHSGLGKKSMIAAVIVALIFLLPIPFRLPCELEVQPITRRFVNAPFEGILEKTVAKSGSVVQIGDLLAVMDGENLRIQLSGLQAELKSAEKKRDQSRATQDIAEAQIQKSECSRIQSEIDLVHKRLSELEIRSPMSGIVVSGDLDHAEGAKLQLGQNLFEIGPLDKMLVEIQVPDESIRFAKVGQATQIKFNAFPFRNWTGTLTKIHPRSEIIDNSNVFIAEVEIENPDGSLQPGMKGRAKISNGWACLGWVYLHRPWEDLRYWFVW